jgi:succinate dehydrogenase/fumarate reductase-like Fe-S protein
MSYEQQIGGRCACKCLCITLYDGAFVKRAMRKAGRIKDVVTRDAELSAIQQVHSSLDGLVCCMHVQYCEDVCGADAGMVSATTTTVSPRFR